VDDQRRANRLGQYPTDPDDTGEHVPLPDPTPDGRYFFAGGTWWTLPQEPAAPLTPPPEPNRIDRGYDPATRDWWVVAAAAALLVAGGMVAEFLFGGR
jgi:hypothetical protein